ncbi:competence type IV pilus ATPase ComGA [Lactobacillus sp. ESL0791]|uniref:competence type IV pilus ATPase ComGA n=1 Tax=Lactobacillus sp. ESL0791 TaxID=2983234 RepID=UPI0023F6F277|nr:competence type IV pilus ATPase ComGA [Lactobacillus sp. ESL0791]MDF7638686.1 competence type IV pilus ATPase ComGA [Lactobacillus sp. ESL0791]
MEAKDVVHDLLEKAICAHISDIFFRSKKQKIAVFFRWDEKIVQQKTFDRSLGQEIINFLKYSAQMNISEHRRPQVGALKYCYQNQDYYLRLSSLGDFYDQESLVIRIIYQISLSNYFFPDQIQQLIDLTKKKGLIVTSGPTGSGKTTTMYKLAKRVGQEKMVMTIEDPVEVEEVDFLQTQVNNEAEIDYQTLLKAALRHRPDILIIGEIRDPQTARLAVDAALSGHLVLATVHAKSTLQTISRLEGLQISNSELANCLTAVSYQRLLPKETGLACLLDLCYGKALTANIGQKVRANFISWQENLQLLVKRGEITDGVYKDFKEG